MKHLHLSIAALILAVTPAFAQVSTYSVDGYHSEVGFKVRYLVGKTAGSFSKYGGTLKVDEKDITKSSVEVTVDAASVNTNNEARDKHLRTPDFFDVEKFPTLSFKSVAVRQLAPGKLEVTGDFTLRGVTKRITVPVTSLGATTHPMTKKTVAAFETSFTIARKDYGVSYGLADAANVVVGNEVDINLTIFANKIDGQK